MSAYDDLGIPDAEYLPFYPLVLKLVVCDLGHQSFLDAVTGEQARWREEKCVECVNGKLNLE